MRFKKWLEWRISMWFNVLQNGWYINQREWAEIQMWIDRWLEIEGVEYGELYYDG